MSRLDLLVGMRLHSLILALKSGVPVVGLSYDPKVRSVLREFNQPMIDFEHVAGEKDSLGVTNSWKESLKTAIDKRSELSKQAKLGAAKAQEQACQNFQALAKILGSKSSQK